MAIGDIATAAGLSLVASSADKRLGYQEINRTRDYVGTIMGTVATTTASLATYLSKGVAGSGFLNRITKVNGIVTIVGRILNGSGLTLSTSLQTIGTIPAWARPADSVSTPATTASTSTAAYIQIDSDGSLRVASAATSLAFSISYPV